jgi:DNA-binding XRE family transcriptional regulator
MDAQQFATARAEFDLSPAEMANVLGISTQRVNTYEAGKKPVDDTTQALIAAFRQGFRPQNWPQGS